MDKKTFLVIATPIVIIVVTLGTALFFIMGYQDSETVLAGMLGFTGAIIGGAITLYGVRMTINNNAEMIELGKIPIKLKHIRSNKKILWMVWDIYDIQFESLPSNNIKVNTDNERVERLFKNEDLIDNSIELGVYLYKSTLLTRDFLTTKKFSFLANLNNLDKAEKSMDKEKLELLNGYYRECQTLVHKLILEYEKEEERLSEIYDRY